MEGVPHFRSIEEIDGLLEDFASREEVDPEAALSDLLTFFGIAKEDEDAKAYLEAMADELGISEEEVEFYAAKKAEGLNEG